MLKLKYALSLAMLVGMAGTALAAEFFIVQGPEKKCWIVEKRPAEKTVVIVGDKVYVSREDAEKQIKVVCKEVDETKLGIGIGIKK